MTFSGARFIFLCSAVYGVAAVRPESSRHKVARSAARSDFMPWSAESAGKQKNPGDDQIDAGLDDLAEQTTTRQRKRLSDEDIDRLAPTPGLERLFILCPILMITLSIMAIRSFGMWEQVNSQPKDEAELEASSLLHRGGNTWDLYFKDFALEKRWIENSQMNSYVLGSRALLFLCVILIAELIREGRWGQGYLACRYGLGAENTNMQWNLELCGMMALTILCCACWKFPNQGLYVFLVSFFFIYVHCAAVPPLNISCHDLEQHAECKKHREKAVMAVDCGLQGTSQMQLIIAWILLLPWVIPRLSTMKVVWVASLFTYGTLTAVTRGTAKEVYFTWAHVAVSLGIMAITLYIATTRKHALERSQRAHFVYDLKQREATEKMFRIFEYMMPAHVILPLVMNPHEPIAEPIDRVSILFVVITDFEDFAAKSSPSELLKFLNNIFGQMDALCEDGRVTKVETVGEEYVAAVGVIPADVEETKLHGHGPILTRLFEVAEKMLQLQDEKVQFKMGMHTGPIVAGVIGHKLPRFRLFGDTINTSARMMQKSLPGKLQFGEDTKAAMPEPVLSRCEFRGEVEMKGKGFVKAWNFPPGPVSDGKGRTAVTRDVIPPKRVQRASLLGVLTSYQPAKSKFKKIGKMAILLNRTGGDAAGGGAPAASPLTAIPETSSFNEDSSANNAFGCVKSLSRVGFEFDEVLDKVSANEEMGFSRAAMEDAWRKAFHDDNVCFGLRERISIQVLILSLFTAAEAAYMVTTECWEKPHELFPGNLRLPVFLGCRVSCAVVLFLWQAASKQTWFEESPDQVQGALVLSFCIVGGLLFLSYDMIVTYEDDLGFISMIYDQSNQPKVRAPFDQNFVLLFVLAFYIVTTQKFYRYTSSLAFVCLAIGLQFASKFHGIGNNFFLDRGRWLFVANVSMGTFIAYEAEKSSRRHYKATHAVEVCEKRVDGILSTLMPPLVVKELRERPDNSNPSHQYKAATIAQSDLCGFTKLAATRTPREVVEFVSDLFGRFDVLTDKYDVYKVETIGDAYIAGMAEKPLTEKNLPVSVVLFGLDMILATGDWARKLGVEVTCRVGVHHGECVGGIVGIDMQRYHLFGHFMAALDTLEATSQEAVAQVSEACKNAMEKQLKDEGKTFEAVFGAKLQRRTEDQLQTSKGEVHTYEEVGGRSYLIKK